MYDITVALETHVTLTIHLWGSLKADCPEVKWHKRKNVISFLVVEKSKMLLGISVREWLLGSKWASA